jgi:hypothetical protein
MATTAGVLARLKSRYNDPNNNILADEDWIGYINDAYSWVQSASGPEKWAFMESSATLVYTHGFPSTTHLPKDIGVLNVVFDVTDGYILEPFPTRAENYIQFPTLTDVGSPAYYRLKNDFIELWPTPQADVTLLLEYQGGLLALDEDNAVSDPLIPDRHIGTLIERVLYLAYQDDDDEQTAGVHKAEADALLVNMKTDLLGGRTTRNPQIVDEWW